MRWNAESDHFPFRWVMTDMNSKITMRKKDTPWKSEHVEKTVLWPQIGGNGVNPLSLVRLWFFFQYYLVCFPFFLIVTEMNKFLIFTQIHGRNWILRRGGVVPILWQQSLWLAGIVRVAVTQMPGLQKDMRQTHSCLWSAVMRLPLSPLKFLPWISSHSFCIFLFH